MQSFAARLAQLTELKAAPMPSWWKPSVHDAHLLIASCIYGESGSYRKTMYEYGGIMVQGIAPTGFRQQCVILVSLEV